MVESLAPVASGASEGPGRAARRAAPPAPPDAPGRASDAALRRARPPTRTWFARDVLVVARELLGAVVRTGSPEGAVAVRLTEVEAYRGADDPASHAFRGRTARNEQMFRAAGHLYVYRHLGLHHCLNVVTGRLGEPAAVLLRAGEVVEGADLAWARRAAGGAVYSPVDLAQGPARLAVSLGLDLRADGADLVPVPGRVPAPLGRATSVEVCLAVGARGAVAAGPRVGVGREGSDPHLFPWRLWLDGEPTVTRYRAGFR